MLQEEVAFERASLLQSTQEQLHVEAQASCRHSRGATVVALNSAAGEHDVGALLELQYDGRDEDEPLTLTDNDLFAGIRLALNDTQDSTMLTGMGYDLETSETYLNIEAERRLGEDTVVELRARFFTNAGPSDTGYAIENDDYLQLQLSRYF